MPIAEAGQDTRTKFIWLDGRIVNLVQTRQQANQAMFAG